MVAPMAKREVMEELEASRGPGMSLRLKVRLINVSIEALRELEGF
jgi:hypothetical protein